MFNQLFTNEGKIRISKLLTIILTIAFFAYGYSKLLNLTNTVYTFSILESLVLLFILVVQVIVLLNHSIKNLITFIESFVIKDVSKTFINFKFNLFSIFKKNHKEGFPFYKNINLIEFSVFRCWCQIICWNEIT